MVSRISSLVGWGSYVVGVGPGVRFVVNTGKSSVRYFFGACCEFRDF